ncbi:MAG: hypothetical protein AB8H80_09730 [Planctomycetota bacterium]
MILRYTSLTLAALTAASLSAQTWNETSAGETVATLEGTVGNGPLTRIVGDLGATEAADIFLIHVDDVASFSCSSVGGATWDTQLWMWDLQGNGISFRDDDTGNLRSTLSGQFLSGPGPVIVGISEYDVDCQDDLGQQLWLDQPFDVERQPDDAGAFSAFTQWSGLSATAGAYTLTLTGASFASPDTPQEASVAWAWCNLQGTAPTTFTPSLSYQHTPSGELITVDWVSTGRYEVDLPLSMAQTGAAHACAYGGNHTALVEAWGYIGGKMKIFVSVVDPSGALTDGNFSISYREGGADDERAAYLWANDAASPSYTPSTTYSWNGNRADPTIARSGPGVYQVTLPGITNSGQPEGGHVQVSAYSGFGGTTLSRAKVAIWSGSATDMVINVLTFDAAGAPADARFVLSYHQNAASIPAHLGSGAHVWADQPTATVNYMPNPFWTDSNGTFGPADSENITRISDGVYDVFLPNVQAVDSSNAMVTAYGTGTPIYASIGLWLPSGSGTRVRVNTYDVAGTPTDSRFDLNYLTNYPAGAPATNTTIGTGCNGLVLVAETRPVLGTDWDMSLADLPATSVVGLVSLGFINPSFPLDVLGAPGCFAYQNQVSLNTVTLPSPSPSYSLSIPNTASLIGGVVYAQGAVFASGINALNLVTSNGVLATLGDV